MNPPRLLVITPGDPTGRPLARWIAWLDAVSGAGADAVLVREPDLPPEDATALVDAATTRFAQVVVHARTPSGAATARSRGLTLHVPDRAPMPVDTAFSASTHDGAGVDAALAAGARFVLLSPVWRPSSKPDDPRPALGFDRFVALAVGRPVLALGGVDPGRLAALRRAGVAGAAVLGPTRGSPEEAGAAVRALLAGGG